MLMQSNVALVPQCVWVTPLELRMSCLLPTTTGSPAADALLWQRPPYVCTNLVFCVVFVLYTFSLFHFLALRRRSSSLRSLTVVLCSWHARNSHPSHSCKFCFRFLRFLFFGFYFLHFKPPSRFVFVAVVRCCLIYDWWRMYKRQKYKSCSRFNFIVAVCSEIYIFRSKVQVQSERNE